MFLSQHHGGYPKNDSFVLFTIWEFRIYHVQLDLQLICDVIYKKYIKSVYIQTCKIY